MKIKIDRLTQIICIIVCFSAPLSVQAQVNVGLNPPDISWFQINNPDYQVIYPKSRQNDAFRVADLLDRIVSNDSLTLSYPPIRVPIILQNQTVIPNGFVTIGPWRSEFNLNPPQFQFAGTVPWLDMLTIHEYRHVQQVANARRGFAGKSLRVLFGQGGWAFYNRGVMPRWYLEGDAVYAETILSKGGRGRSPDFERAYRALRLSGLNYNYEKASFQSYKDFVPSHYHLGYFLTTYARKNFGADVWDRVLNDTYSKPGLYRFSKAVKNHTGSSTKELYSSAMMDLDHWWNNQDADIFPLESNQLSKSPDKVYTNYRYPNYSSDSSLVVLKSSLSQIRTLYTLRRGTEQKLVIPGVSLSENYSLGGGVLGWNEVRFHPRWSNKTYSVIRLYDLQTGKLRKITSRSRFFGVGLSNDGKWIAAIEVLTTGDVNLVILDAQSGQVNHKTSVPEGDMLSFPRWNDDNRTVIVAGRNLSGNFLNSYDVPTRSWKKLIAPTFNTIDRIYPKGKYVYFSSSRTGVQNIFALDITTTEMFQITDSRFGAFDPAVSPDGRKLAYSEYTAMGFQIRELLLTDALWKQPITAGNLGSNYYLDLIPQEVGDITQNTVKKSHEVAPYKYFTKGLLNIHSWYPFVSTEEFGFGVLSKNIMSTLAINGQFTYNTNENSWKTLVGSSYGAFFPILDIDLSTGQRESNFLLSVTDSVNLYVGKWKEHTFSGGIRLPFNITHGAYPSSISLSSKYRYYLVDYLDGVTDNARDENFGSLDFDFGFLRLQSRAHQNINPRWGQTLKINYQKTLGNTENHGEIFTVNSSLFFPGALANHSLFLTGGYQKEDIVNSYRFEDIFTNARGYSSFPFERIYRVSVNYTLPIWYPDLSIGSLAFFKRLRGNMFYDYSEGDLFGSKVPLRSYGLEIVTDFRLVRLVEVGAGVRLGRKVDDEDYFAEFFITSIRF
ncbi:MAG: hypothetical protein DHS20C17_17540 [Cyclobacteriaceae bacterium]|nr:MAG: hypothetical protein DHS20C17_17540 [Cyclobacteriaceae bacterium]